MRKRVMIAFACTFVAALLVAFTLTPTLAYLSDRQTGGAAGQATTVTVSAPTLAWAEVEPGQEMSVGTDNSLRLWAPGDVNTLRWDIDNLGSASIDLRYTLQIYWNEGPGMTSLTNESAGSALWAEAPFIYLYPSTMADADILTDLSSGSPSAFIAIGSSGVQYKNASGATRFGYSYTFAGATLDGVGKNAVTGDATTPGATSDRQEFKLALAPDAPAGFMSRTLVCALQVEGKQHRNTTDSDWHLVQTQAIQ